MMEYFLSFPDPASHEIHVRLVLTASDEQPILLQLPAWRPGRYERQRFDRFISLVEAQDLQGTPLAVEQTSTHNWQVVPSEPGKLEVTYRFFAQQTDAGGSFFNEDQIYVNGINLFLFRPGKLDIPVRLHLDLPHDYEVAGALKLDGDAYSFKDFHELVDSPFFAAPDLQHHAFDVQGVKTHVWFMGRCRPDFIKIEEDIRKYSEAQMAMFGEFPVGEYHYLNLMVPAPYRHGVEHTKSTVISMGPGTALMTPAMYKSFLEISSHELFHTWNVKQLRPSDMWPYDYSGEQYSRLHDITEGVTTYYGDLMLWKGGVWGLDEWVNSINAELRTFHAFGGSEDISLETASFQSWTRQYSPEGIPNHRISFYTKGYLVAMLADFKIRQATHNEFSMDDVVANMYHQIAKAGRGYTRTDYLAMLESVSGISFADFYADYILGTKPLDGLLQEMASYMGLTMVPMPNSTMMETWLRARVEYKDGKCIVKTLLPGSPLQDAGIGLGDELVALNGLRISPDFEGQLAYFGHEDNWDLHYFSHHELRQTSIHRASLVPYTLPQLVPNAILSPSQEGNQTAWKRVDVTSTASTNF
ncbi:hypothetical protein [Pontibacter sp. G13]|uniref:M61 family metallopeptidase n=1 Tax=Pontibacter sp. G13 TaxID=3074898 RepID=UPI00288A03CE|nr:hypothetical protein [Pontibacter sp. G13]WNJ16767.1 hypothetical protein RJD25_18015 [Pontibacter sp. G13]